MDSHYGFKKQLVSHSTVALGNMVSKIFIVVMILATFVLPSSAGAQRDVDVEDPASSGDEAPQENVTEEPTQEPIVSTQEKQPIYNAVMSRNTRTSTQTTAKSIIAAGMLSNKIDPTQLYSYAKGGGRGSILCSTIARINLSLLTGKPYSNAGFHEGTIARGDAYALALRGAARDQMITTSRSTMESDIWDQYEQTHNTIYDVYFYKASNSGVMQGHRAVVFVGTDDAIYILDPIRGLATAKPQTLSDHFAADGYKGYTMYISQFGYAPADEYKTIQEYHEIATDTSLVQLVDDNIVSIVQTPLRADMILTVNEPMKLIVDMEEIIIEQGSRITVERASTLVGWKLTQESGKLRAYFVKPELLAITTAWDK